MSEPRPGAGRTDPLRNPWVRRARRVAYDNPWITVYHDDVLRPDGQPGIYGMVHFKNLAVGVVALDEQDRVLLVGQYRYTLECYSWEIPEGGCAPGEDPLAAAQRELLEETGCLARSWQPLAQAHLSNSVSDEDAICYLATGLTIGQACPEPTELLQVQWLPFTEALRWALTGAITDALSVIGLQRTALLRQSEK
jgi:8-oxo-dGTP pyrophosphatase MutT (NUDIX family)